MHWPVEYGGRGASVVESAIFFEELGRARAPLPANIVGLMLAGPTLMVWSSSEQQERYLEPMLSGDEIWCQGFSEPDAGSDLASVKTRAVRDGDDWIVTGQKVWTSFAQYAKWCILVTRTDPEVPKHKGLTYFVLDMEAEGVQVRPLRQITGGAEFNEVFLEEVRVPGSAVVGGVNIGWKVAMTTLMNERAGIGFFLQMEMRQTLDRLVAELRTRGRLDDPTVRHRVAELHARTEILRLTSYRGLSAIQKYGQPGPEGSLTKWMWSRTNQASCSSPWTHSGRTRSRRTARGASTFSARAAIPSRVERPRSSRTSSPSACSASRRHADMDFNVNEDQAEIQATARAFLAARANTAVVRAAAEAGRCDAGLWREVCELGWPGIAIDERYGGAGLGMVELCLLLEEQGAALAPTPLLPTACAALVIAAAGSDAQREQWLPGLASGGFLGAIGSMTGSGGPGFAAGVEGAHVVVMLDGDDAFLLPGGCDGIEPMATIDPLRSYGLVTERGEPLSGDARRAGSLAAVAIAAEHTGLCQRALDTTVAYVKERRQFGVPVGSFQAVAHRCAEMLLETERLAVRDLLRGVDGRRLTRRRDRSRSDRQVRELQGGGRRARVGDPGARRDRIHVGG